MAIIGMDLTKISVEKKSAVVGKVNVNTNIFIADVKETEINIGKNKEKGVRYSFEYSVKYEVDKKVNATIEIEGNIVDMVDAKKQKEIIDSWKKDKKLPKEVMVPVLNMALTKCNIKALLLSQELNLPPPINLPRIKAK